MQNNILERIFSDRKQDLSELRRFNDSLDSMEIKDSNTKRTSIGQAINSKSKNGAFLITEIKPKSPSKGKLLIDDGINIQSILLQMVEGGSSAISVLTEPHYFGGSFENLKKVSLLTTIPILMKDFIFDPIQIQIASKIGVSNILLIASYSDMNTLLPICKEENLEALVEIHNEGDFDELLKFYDEFKENIIIGINNRDLKTLKTDLNNTKVLFPKIQDRLGKNIHIISESGFESRQEIEEFEQMGIKGFLIGSSIMLSDNISRKIKELGGN